MEGTAGERRREAGPAGDRGEPCKASSRRFRRSFKLLAGVEGEGVERVAGVEGGGGTEEEEVCTEEVEM